jgi:hypothetical protein
VNRTSDDCSSATMGCCNTLFGLVDASPTLQNPEHRTGKV